MGTSINRFLNDDDKPLDLVGDYERDKQQREGRLNTAATVGPSSPQKSTRVLQLQQKTGLDHSLIADNLDDVETKVWRSDFASKQTSYGPALTGWLAENPHHLAAAAKDLTNLSWLERQVANIKDQFESGANTIRIRNLAEKAYKGTITPAEKSQLEAIESQEATRPSSADYGFSGFVSGIPGALANQIPILANIGVRSLSGGLAGASAGTAIGAVTGAAGNVAAPVTLPVGAATGASVGFFAGAVTAAAVESGNLEKYLAYREFSQMKDARGLPLMSDQTAKVAASVTGVLNGALEMLELGQVTKNIPVLRTLGREGVKKALRQQTVRQAIQRFATNATGTAIAEGSTEFMQDVVKNTAGELSQMITDGSINRLSTGEIIGRIFSPEHMQEAISDAKAGAQAGVGTSVAGGTALVHDVRRAQRAQSHAQFFHAIGDVAKQSELTKSLPEKMQEAVERITREGPVETVHAPLETWNEYWQSKNLDPAEVAREVTGSDEAYEQASAAGHDLEIPTARYATTIAPTEHNDFFAQEIRFSPDQMNGREAEAFVKNLREEVQNQSPEATEVKKAAEALSKRITEQLIAAGVEKDAAQLQAEALYGRPFRTLAARGVDLKVLAAMFERLQVTREQAKEVVGEQKIPDGGNAQTPDDVIEDALAKTITEDGEKRFVDARTPTGTRRKIARVSTMGLIAEWRDFTNKMEDAGRRAQYNWTVDENFHSTEDARTVASADRPKGSRVSYQARALQNLEDYTRITADIEKELKSRGMTDDEIGSLLLMDDEAFAERSGRATPEGHSYEQTITDEQGNELFQRKGDVPRGRIRVGSAEINITLLEDADLSTFIHETGHFYTEVLSQLSKENESVARDYATIREWVGATRGDPLTRDQHEQIARGFEAYLMEGKAPSSELRSAFARMKAWMLLVYRSLKGLNVELTDEVRGVFDRLLASQEEIEAANTDLGPLFSDPESLGMTKVEAEKYSRAIVDAKVAATDALDAKLMKEVQREQNAQWKAAREKVRAQVAQEVNEDPKWRALSILQRGILPDGSPLPEGIEPFKLDRQAIVDMYGDEEILKSLPRPYIYRREGGVHPDQAAELLGFPSGVALIKDLPSSGTAQQHLEALTDERMKQEHGDLLTDGRLPVEAMKAVHSEKRAQLLQMELRHLASKNLASLKGLVRRVSQRVPPIDAVRSEAQRIVNQKRTRDLKPNNYLIAERKASRNAVDALLRGDVQTAFEEKQRELFNHELYTAAVDARDENERIARYLSRFDNKKVRERLGKAGGSYLDQIDALLDRFDFRVSITNRALDKRESLLKFVAQNPDVEIPEYLLDEANRKHYQEMTHDEMVGLRDTIKQIDHLARFKNQLIADKEKRELNALASDIVSSVVANAKSKRAPEIETRLPQNNARRAIGAWFASHRKFASLVRQMDGYADGGIFWDATTRKLNEAADNEAVGHESATIELKKLFDLYTASEHRQMYQKQAVAGTSLQLSKMGRLMMALNWGNDLNRERVLSGYGKKSYDEATVQKILDGLDERDWKFVQGVWDFIDTYWPELQSLGKDLTGLAPTKVEATPIQTKFGEMSGGYFPIVYDDRQSERAHQDLVGEMADRIKHGAIVKATTERGMLKERVEHVEREVRLDFGVIFEHVNEVIHTITHTRALTDVQKVLSHDEVRDAVVAHYGDVVYRELTNTVNSVAAGDLPAANAFEKGMNWVRQGSTIVGLGYSFVTSMLQPAGLSNSAARIGAKWVGRGVAKWIGSPKEMQRRVEWVHEKSDFMRLRHKTMQREINEIRNQIGLNADGKLARWIDEALEKTVKNKVTRQGVSDSFLYMIGKAQMIADVPTWLGAYEKFSADPENLNADGTLDEKRVIALADQVVLDSQGGGQIKDLASVQRGGPLLKIWTNFYSYFNVVYNQLAEATGKRNLKNPAEIGRLAGDFALIIVIPSLVSVLVHDARGSKDDDDDSYLSRLPKKLAKDIAAQITGLMLLAREISGFVQGYTDYSGPAGTRIFGQVGRLVKQVEQGELDAGLLKALNQVGGILFHYPAVQVERTSQGIAALLNGDTSNPLSILFGPAK